MNAFGRNFRVSLFGESHGAAIGVVIDGVPAGVPLSKEDFFCDIDRRRSGANGTTARKESDCPEILSGVCGGFTTGSPLAVIFRNDDIRPEDYKRFKDIPRPGHTDRVAYVKWNGYNDANGGGHFSGRLTLPLVAAGVVAKKVFHSKYQDRPAVNAEIIEIGGASCCESPGKIDELVSQAEKDGDSLGGIVECNVLNLPVGVGEPFFDSVESMLSHAVFAIPGVRGIEFGDGFAAARMRGSQHNDVFGENGYPVTNGAGGINGGISNGAPLVFRVAFKPTSSIHKAQTTLNFSTGQMETLELQGRHDVCFALRTPVVVEAVTAIVLADLMITGKFL